MKAYGGYGDEQDRPVSRYSRLKRLDTETSCQRSSKIGESSLLLDRVLLRQGRKKPLMRVTLIYGAVLFVASIVTNLHARNNHKVQKNFMCHLCSIYFTHGVTLPESTYGKQNRILQDPSKHSQCPNAGIRWKLHQT